MRRLRTGSHLVSRAALAQLGLAAPAAGLVVGVDYQSAPVAVRLFRPEPTRVTIVGGNWAPQVLVFRALAAGAQVLLISDYAENWLSFAQHATGSSDRLVAVSSHLSVGTARNAAQMLSAGATARAPILVVDDRGQAASAFAAPLGPWQAQITLLHQLDQSGMPMVQGCDLAILQRLGQAEATLAGHALRLSTASLAIVQTMSDDVFALIADGEERYVKVTQTDIERSYTGNPRRT
jgi:ESX secretion system protein EccE